MITTNPDIVAHMLRAYDVVLPPEDFDALITRLAANAELLHTLTERIDYDALPALRPAWTLRSEVSAPGPDEVVGQLTRPVKNNPDGAAGAERRMTAQTIWRDRSPTEAVEEALAKAAAYPDAAVFTELFAEKARADARDLEQRYAGRGDKPPLWGTTVAVKDLINIAGRRMTGGSRALNTPVADADAKVVSLLRQAGAVVIGANNLHELAFGTTGENPHFGTVDNPAAPGLLAGGSSSGSAAAVGFGMATFAIGTDTGGSIRIPASCCGIVGFKPSFNMLPRDGTFPLGYSLDHLGPLTKTVADAALIMDVLLKRSDRNSVGAEATLRGVRLGVPRDYFTIAADSVSATYDRVLRDAKAAGARLVPISLNRFETAPAVYLATSGAEAAAIHYRTLAHSSAQLGSDVRVRLTAALFIPAFARIRAQQLRRLLFDDLAAAFAEVDVIVTPTLPITPPPPGTTAIHAGDTTLPTSAAFLRNTCPFNLTGVPAISIPARANPDGVPIGLQIVGPYGADVRVLQVARAFEREVIGRVIDRATC